MMIVLVFLCSVIVTTCSSTSNNNLDDTMSERDMNTLLSEMLTESEYVYGRMRGHFGSHPWMENIDKTSSRQGRVSNSFKSSKLWPNARVPYQVANTIDHREWLIVQSIFSNISSLTNIQFIPRTAKDTDYLLISEDIQKYGCGCCSIGVGYLEGAGAHVLVLAPVAEGGCGVNHIGGTHEMLHILGLTHVQNRPDRCNYIDVDTSGLVGWGEWAVGSITPYADWFQLRIPYDCSSYVHYYQLQGAVWKDEVMKEVDKFMEDQGCESFQRGRFINKCVVDGGYTDKNRITKDGYNRCLEAWDAKHKACVQTIFKRYPTFRQVDPNGRCEANGINKTKRKSYQLSQWDIWALNAAYGGPLPPCQRPQSVGNGVCDPGNNNVGCDYDGGDCCLPQAKAYDCIDPCGVRLKFYNGTNRECTAAPETDNFCRDHYWYGPNRCSSKYCRVTEEKYLQWQCKKTCNLCNVSPSRLEMDAVCDRFISPQLKQKYSQPFSKRGKISQSTLNSLPSFPPKQLGNPAKRLQQPKSNEVRGQSIGGQKGSRTQNSKPVKSLRPNNPQTSVKKKSSDTRKNNRFSKFDNRKANSQTSSKQIRNNINSIQTNRRSKPSANRKLQQTVQSSNQRQPKQDLRSESGKKSRGFVVISSPERRLEMRSYWTRKG